MIFWLLLTLVIFVAGFFLGASRAGVEVEADMAALKQRAEAAEAKVLLLVPNRAVAQTSRPQATSKP